jgi:hypothetical protein
MLGIIYKAYNDFESRFRIVHDEKISSKDRIANLLQDSIIPISKADILTLLPDISKSTVDRGLWALMDESKVEKIGNGRAVKYRYIGH